MSPESEGTVSFTELFTGNTDLALKAPDHQLGDIAFMMCRGGWPEVLRRKSAAAAQLVETEYYQVVTHTDISKMDGVTKNPKRVKRLMRYNTHHQDLENARLFAPFGYAGFALSGKIRLTLP